MPVIVIVDLVESLPYTTMIIHERVLQSQHGAIITMVRLSYGDLTWKSMKMAERLGSALVRIGRQFGSEGAKPKQGKKQTTKPAKKTLQI